MACTSFVPSAKFGFAGKHAGQRCELTAPFRPAEKAPGIDSRCKTVAACCRSVVGVSSRAAPRPCLHDHKGFTLVELLIILAIVAVLIAFLVPAIQRVREAANRIQCSNNLKQMGTALHAYHDVNGTFPHAYDARALFQDPSKTPLTPRSKTFIVTKSWATLILPFIEQENLERAGYGIYSQRQVPVYVCPSDRRGTQTYSGAKGYGAQGLTDYLAVTGTMTFNGDPESGPIRPKCNGVIYESSRTRSAEITDGTSTTVLVGERPPSLDLFWGWWTWSALDAALGVRNNWPVYGGSGGDTPIYCMRLLPENYRPSDHNNCDTHHFWSAHPGGGNWLFADSSVRFLPYRSNPILPALATRAGGEVIHDEN